MKEFKTDTNVFWCPYNIPYHSASLYCGVSMYHLMIFVAVNELATYCDSLQSGSPSFNSTSNQVTVKFHSDGSSSHYYASRGFSLRFNASQEGEFRIIEMLLINLLILLVHWLV